jgi:hypothetical protein
VAVEEKADEGGRRKMKRKWGRRKGGGVERRGERVAIEEKEKNRRRI